jgi:hypothetical protein
MPAKRPEYVLSHFDWIRKWVPLTAIDAPVNIHRQAFVLLMTAFDAAVFDIARVALCNDFFKLIAMFGEDDKLALKNLSAYVSFDEFRDQLIEKQLKSLYVKDVPSTLRDARIKVTTSGNGRQFVELMDLVRRRNLHVHNRGYVDERYLNRDEKGQSIGNIYNYSVGQIAAIDATYWQHAIKLCRDCIQTLTQWARPATAGS